MTSNLHASLSIEQPCISVGPCGDNLGGKDAMGALRTRVESPSLGVLIIFQLGRKYVMWYYVHSFHTKSDIAK